MNSGVERTLVVSLHRFRRSRGAVGFGSMPQPFKVSPLARSLALGHYCVHLVESGKARNYSVVATRLGISQARVAQAVQLTFLAPRIQETVLLGRMSLTREELFRLAGRFAWADQIRQWLSE